MNLHSWVEWIAGEQLQDLTAVRFEFNVFLGFFTCLFILLVVGGGVLWFSWMHLQGLRWLLRSFLSTLRMLVILAALFLVLDPCLVGEILAPGDQYVVLLFDDSKSMQVTDDDGQTRGQRLIETYEHYQTDFEDHLKKKYQLAKFRMGASIEPLEEIAHLDFSQTTSAIYQAIESSLRELEGLHVSAVVLFSDGVQQPAQPSFPFSRIQQSKIPVFTVGTGDSSPWRDLRISRLSLHRTHFDKSPVVIHAAMEAKGLAQQVVQASILLNGKTVTSNTVEITHPDQTIPLHFEFQPTQKEWLEYTLRVRTIGNTDQGANETGTTSHAQERTPQNNVRSFLVDNTPKTFRILFYSSHPNWEHRFISRALKEDEQLKLSSLVLLSQAQRKFVFRGARTSMTNPLFEGFGNDQEQYGRYDEPIYLRLGLGETELAKGFPRKKEDLFSFHALMIGEVDWKDFSAQQMAFIHDFVDQRGGSLLLLGGKDQFTSEPFLNSPLASMLPLLPSPSVDLDDGYVPEFFHVAPSFAGELSGTWSLDSDPEENQAHWDAMPELFGINRFAMTRPGATVYAHTQPVEKLQPGDPFFAMQRYGKGRCALIATGNTWPWRMRSPASSNEHERLWRQWVRHLVHDVPEPIQLLNPQDAYNEKEPIHFKMHARDTSFEDLEGARVNVTIQTPSEHQEQPSVEESIQEPGLFTWEWFPNEVGKHLLSVHVSNAEKEEIGSFSRAFLVEEDRREFEQAQYNPAFLQTIASRSNGRFFELDQMADIPNWIPWQTGNETNQRRIHLWYNPFFFVLLIVLLSLEWFLRRRHGHP